MTSSRPKWTLPLLGACLALALAACNLPQLSASTPTPVFTLTPSVTPTVTPLPGALTVNGQGITVAEFDAAVTRYLQAQQGLGQAVDRETAAQAVEQDLVDTLLLGQGAAAAGQTVDDAALQARLDALAAQVGGPEALTAWETAHGYTEADFRADLQRQMAAALMRDQIAASVPTTAEQVHVKQILLYNSEEAQQALGYLQAGADFNDLAAQYDPVTKGELGWFPRGYLLEPALEEAAFALQPGQYSGVVQTQAGFHILYMVERSPDRPLSPDALLALQQRAISDWLAQQRSTSTIQFEP
jgi:parvulin-like peptidyl-prolyl isomerase